MNAQKRTQAAAGRETSGRTIKAHGARRGAFSRVLRHSADYDAHDGTADQENRDTATANSNPEKMFATPPTPSRVGSIQIPRPFADAEKTLPTPPHPRAETATPKNARPIFWSAL